MKTASKIGRGPDGKPVFVEGRLTMMDAEGRIERFTAVPATKVTLNGAPFSFRAAAAGMVVARAVFDPGTKELSALVLKSAPADAVVTGEIAGVEIFNGSLSLRTGSGRTREFSVTERTSIEGTTGMPVTLDALKVGDVVDVTSKDGKAASVVRLRAAP